MVLVFLQLTVTQQHDVSMIFPFYLFIYPFPVFLIFSFVGA